MNTVLGSDDQIIEEHFCLSRILTWSLPYPGQTISPYYRQGMLYDGLYRGDIVAQENLDLSLLLVNRKFHEVGSTVFYSSHRFHLADPVVAKWWLQNIGATNAGKIQSLCLEISSGYRHGGPRERAMDLSVEERWLQALRWFRPHCRLRHLDLSFDEWTASGEIWGHGDPRRYVGDLPSQRGRLLKKLAEFKGIRWVRLEWSANSRDFADDFEMLWNEIGLGQAREE